MTFTETEEKQALKAIILEQLRKERSEQLEARRRQRQQEQLAKQVETATDEFESKLAVLRERTQALTAKQISWRKRLEFILFEMDRLSDEQPEIQQEIKAILNEIESAIYRTKQQGALVNSDVQTHWDSIGGDSDDLKAFPEGVSNLLAMRSAKWQNEIASMIYGGNAYNPKRLLDGRRRV
jgi:TolA-binding protein